MSDTSLLFSIAPGDLAPVLRDLRASGSLETSAQVLAKTAANVPGVVAAQIWVVREGDLCTRGCPYAAAGTDVSGCGRPPRCFHRLAAEEKAASTGVFVAGGLFPSSASWRRLPLSCLPSAGADVLSFSRPGAEPFGFLAFASGQTLPPASQSALTALADLATLALGANLAQEECAGARKALRLLADNTPDYVYALDREGVVIAINTAAAAVFGAKPEEMIGLPMPVPPGFSCESVAEL
ncbi:MAG: PAS domain-containing protein, partial [Thermoleophilia bacterium]|nr:PAS domain-containing protein [Thermoleophilia bacterium]